MVFSHDSFFSAHHFLKVVPKIHTSTAVISLSTREIKISCPKPSDKKREIRAPQPCNRISTQQINRGKIRGFEKLLKSFAITNMRKKGYIYLYSRIA